jgi:nitrite reductase/ring-hydroxylating ferredoxin subunit
VTRPVIDLERVLCTLRQLEAKGSVGFVLGDGDWPLRGFVVLVRPGVVRAYENWCPHAGHGLDLVPERFLSADGALIQCSSHGALFEKEDGLCIAGPCEGRALRSLRVELVDGFVLRCAPAGAGTADD